MFHYTGNYFCTKSCWDNDFYDCNNLISVEGYPDEYSKDDFENITTEKKILNKEKYDRYKKLGKYDEELIKDLSEDTALALKKKVKDWLNNIVEDNKETGEKGWCVGTDEYNSGNIDFSLFFYRRKDALKFIKEWSVYRKPTGTYNQDTYVEKRLNLSNNKLEIKES